MEIWMLPLAVVIVGLTAWLVYELDQRTYWVPADDEDEAIDAGLNEPELLTDERSLVRGALLYLADYRDGKVS